MCPNRVGLSETAKEPAMVEEQKKSRLLTRAQGDVMVVHFLDTRILDVANINQIAEELSDIVEKKNYNRLLLNLTNVEYLSSAVLAKLIALHKRLKELKGELRVCSVRDSIMEVFKITKLDKVFDIQPTEEEALARFKVRGF